MKINNTIIWIIVINIILLFFGLSKVESESYAKVPAGSTEIKFHDRDYYTYKWKDMYFLACPQGITYIPKKPE